jgi:hypothetical protein
MPTAHGIVDTIHIFLKDSVFTKGDADSAHYGDTNYGSGSIYPPDPAATEEASSERDHQSVHATGQPPII